MEKEYGWITFSGKPIPDIKTWVKEATNNGQILKIGCDSLQTAKYSQFVTVAVVHTPGKGGRVAYKRLVVPRIKSLRERLLKETLNSTMLAIELSPVVKGVLEVHIDASPEEKNLSNKYVAELVGMVMGNGFKAVIKPDSAVASHVADHVVRSFGKLPKAA